MRLPAGVMVGFAYVLACAWLGFRLPVPPLLRGERPGPTSTASASASPTPLPTSPSNPDAPYCGRSSEPLADSLEKRELCLQQLKLLGDELSARIEKGQGVRPDQLGLAYRCPTSGLVYRWFVQPGRNLLYCHGGSHPGHALHWDSASRQAASDWPDLADGPRRSEALVLRLEASRSDEDSARSQAILQELAGTDIDPDQLWIWRAELELDRDDPGKALQALQKLQHGESNPAAQLDWLQALLAQRSFREAEESASELLLDDAANQPVRMLQLIALVYEDRWEDARASCEKLHQPFYAVFVHMALGQYDQARLAALQLLKSEGWEGDQACLAAILALLNGWKESEGESMLRSELAEALGSAPKAWPYPVLRFLNRELTEEELLELTEDSPVRRREALFFCALRALWKDGQPLESQRQRLQEVEGYPRYLEGMVAHSLLHPGQAP